MKIRTMFRACNAAGLGYQPGAGSRKPGRSHAGPLWICSCCGAPIRVRHPGLSGLAQLRRREIRLGFIGAAARAGRVAARQATLDHVARVADGGSSDLANVRLAHRACNERRGIVDQRADRMRKEPALTRLLDLVGYMLAGSA